MKYLILTTIALFLIAFSPDTAKVATPPSCTWLGRITFRDGQPARGVDVTPIIDGVRRPTMRTDSTGYYEVHMPRYSSVMIEIRSGNRVHYFPRSPALMACLTVNAYPQEENIHLPFSSETIYPTPSPFPSASATPWGTPWPTGTPTPMATVTPWASPAASPNSTATPRSTPTPKSYPSASPIASATPIATPLSDQAEIDRIWANMGFGNIAFNVPPTMTLEENYKIVLNLGIAQTAADLRSSLRNQGVTGDLVSERIKIDNNMQAILTGDGFQITPATPDKLPISREMVTEWKWDVRPIRSGSLRLHLVLNALVDLKDGSGKQPYPVRTFDREYQVAVPWKNRAIPAFVGNNWTWLWATIVIPLGGWLWNRRRKKRERVGFVR